MKFLVIDDDPSSLRLARAVIERAGHEVKTVSNPVQVPLMFGEPIDLVLCDVNMPAIDGPTVVRALRRALPNRTPPIVLLSNLDAGELRRRAEECEANDWMQKPLTAASLAELLRNFFSV